MMFSVEMNKKTLLPSSKFIRNAILYVPYLFDCQPPLILSRTWTYLTLSLWKYVTGASAATIFRMPFHRTTIYRTDSSPNRQLIETTTYRTDCSSSDCLSKDKLSNLQLIEPSLYRTAVLRMAVFRNDSLSKRQFIKLRFIEPTACRTRQFIWRQFIERQFIELTVNE